MIDSLPHQYIGIICTGIGVALLVLTALMFVVRMYSNYEKGYLEGTATTLDSMYIAMPAQSILYLGFMCAILFLGVFTLLLGNIVAGLLMGFVAFFIPRLALFILKKRRDELFGIQLVDALMNVSNSLRAGFSLTQAFELVYKEMPAPMSQEVRLMCQELRLGVPMDEALANLYVRMPTADVDLMVTAISIVRDVGGNLTEVFDNIAATIRERQRIEGKIKALTAQGRMQAVVVCMVPFVLGGALYLITPNMFMPMLTTAPGLCMLGVGLILIFLGWLWIRKIVRIDV